jgi:hypothetical protein
VGKVSVCCGGSRICGGGGGGGLALFGIGYVICGTSDEYIICGTSEACGWFVVA